MARQTANLADAKLIVSLRASIQETRMPEMIPSALPASAARSASMLRQASPAHFDVTVTELQLARNPAAAGADAAPVAMPRETIDLTDTVNDIIARHPATVAVFNRFGVDSCCGGGLPLITVTARHGIDPASIVVALRKAVG